MNWLLIVVLLILVGYTLNGYRLGLIKVAFSLVSFVLTILISSLITPYVSDFLIESTPLYDTIKEGTSDFFVEQGEERVNEAMPDVMVTLLYGGEAASEENSLVSDASDYLSSSLADLIIRILSFTVAFIIISIILRATVFTLDIIANLPVIKGINRYAGLAFGLAQGLVIVWIGFLIITIFSTTEFGEPLYSFIQKSQILLFLYNNNFLLQLFGK